MLQELLESIPAVTGGGMGIYPGQVRSPSQDTHTIGGSWENPHRHGEKMQTLHRRSQLGLEHRILLY